MDTPYEPASTRQEFFEWLDTCLCDWQIITDEHGETEIRFTYQEAGDEDEEE